MQKLARKTHIYVNGEWVPVSKFLAELARETKPDGVMVVSTVPPAAK